MNQVSLPGKNFGLKGGIFFCKRMYNWRKSFMYDNLINKGGFWGAIWIEKRTWIYNVIYNRFHEAGHKYFQH